MNNQQNNENNDSSLNKKEPLYVFLMIVGLLMIIILLVVYFSYKPKENVPDKPAIKSVDTNTDNPQNPVEIVSYPYKTSINRSYAVKKSTDYHNYNKINSYYMALIDVDSMELIVGNNYDENMYPASMTKIMTVVVALDYIKDIKDTYVVKKSVLNKVPDGYSTAELKANKTVTVEDLIYGITYRSGADSVLCLVDYLGFTVPEFSELMTKKAKDLGLTKTEFHGAIGQDKEENRTTAKEMAIIMSYVADNEKCLRFFSGKEYKPSYGGVYESLTYKAPDFVKDFTIIGSKSGLEDKAGSCLATYTESKDGKRYVLVTGLADSKDYTFEDYSLVFNHIKN